MPNKLFNAFNALDLIKKNKDTYIPGLLGATLNGSQVVDVPNRLGYVYVRLHSNDSELIQAYNDKVSVVYGLPVLVIRDDIDSTRYRIYGRDTGQYEAWQSTSSFIPIHGGQHSFNPDTQGGGDVVWVYDRQFMPLLVYPSGTNGAMMVMIAPDWIWHNSKWIAAGGTGTSSLAAYKPTGAFASLVLISLDGDGNPKYTAGTSQFATTITGGNALLQYLPTPATTDIPLAMVRFVSGTSSLVWDNLYDLRSFANDLIAASTGTSSSAARRVESQQWVGGAFAANQYVARYIPVHTGTLKQVSLWYYDGETTDSPVITNWTVRKNGSAIDTFLHSGTGNIVLLQRPLNTAVVPGDELAVRIGTNVCPNAYDLMAVFEVDIA